MAAGRNIIQLKLPHLTSIFQVPLSISETHLLQSYVLLLYSPFSKKKKHLLYISIISLNASKFFTLPIWGVSHEKAFKFEKTISGEEGSALDNEGIDIGSKLLAISLDIKPCF